jgi:NCS1 family nucleobase:cation symporter-1
VGVLMMPWKLYADAAAYIFTWLIGYSSLMGAIGGVLIADYFIIRRTKLKLEDLYQREGDYWYLGGFNPLALIAMLIGIAPCVPGFLATVAEQDFPQFVGFWTDLYAYAWFVSFGLALLSYTVLMLAFDRKS